MSRSLMTFTLQLLLLMMMVNSAAAHPWHRHSKSTESKTENSQEAVTAADAAAAADETELVDFPILLAQLDRNQQQRGADVARGKSPEIAKAFEEFVKLKAISTHWNERYFYVESNGIPAHQMMVGITAWQQQVPIPQKYLGDNAWLIPFKPVPAKKPQSAKNAFLRGAIAVAVNGIPIFNPLNNRGDDALAFGELDDFGGHCGRADDYHYHIAPVHLQKTIGKSLPIAYALDGYPIYGYEEPDGSPVVGLDELNGHKDKDGNYHYHATKKYPYLNGGFYGEVVEKDGQVDPQPRAEPLRQSLPPMKGAKIVDFTESKPGSYLLTYEISGKKGTVAYKLGNDGAAQFTFTGTDGKSTTENYQRRERRAGGNGGPPRPGDNEVKKNRDNPPPRNDDRPPPPPNRPDDRPPPPPPRKGEQPVRNAERPMSTRSESSSKPNSALPKLTVSSTSLDANGFLKVDCTCDGKGTPPVVTWGEAPKGTQAFAISLWHTAPDQEKSYWLVYDIPANVTTLEPSSKPVGKLGLNGKRRAEYDPMCSKGPGVKDYQITVFALSKELRLAPDKVARASLLEAVKGITLAEGTLTYRYERK